MRMNKDFNYWIHYSIILKDGSIVKKSVICDKYTEVLGKVVTESHDFFDTDVVCSHIIPTKLVDKIILYDKVGKVIDSIDLK